MSIQENTFAEACYNQNTIEELQAAFKSPADETDMQEWGLTESEYFDEIKTAVLEKIEEKTVTLQQEKGFNAYAKHIEETEIEASEEGFRHFYSAWCAEEGRFNDINESNF